MEIVRQDENTGREYWYSESTGGARWKDTGEEITTFHLTRVKDGTLEWVPLIIQKTNEDQSQNVQEMKESLGKKARERERQRQLKKERQRERTRARGRERREKRKEEKRQHQVAIWRGLMNRLQHKLITDADKREQSWKEFKKWDNLLFPNCTWRKQWLDSLSSKSTSTSTSKGGTNEKELWRNIRSQSQSQSQSNYTSKSTSKSNSNII